MGIHLLFTGISSRRRGQCDGRVTWMRIAWSAVTSLREAVTTQLASVTLVRGPRPAVQQPYS